MIWMLSIKNGAIQGTPITIDDNSKFVSNETEFTTSIEEEWAKWISSFSLRWEIDEKGKWPFLIIRIDDVEFICWKCGNKKIYSSKL